MESNTREDYFNLKKKKLKKQIESIPLNLVSKLFNGMIFYINGNTDPSPYKLQEMIKENGGKYVISRFQKFTHVLSCSISKSSLNSYQRYPVLKPKWLLDSIESNKLMEMNSYLLNRTDNLYTGSIKLCFERFNKSDENDIKQNYPSMNSSNEHLNIKSYYEKSRLHHLSMLKSYFKNICFKNFIHKRTEELTPTQMIAHFDMDCFFASVSIVNRPDLAHKPVAVTHALNQDTNSTSNIASCNYVARKFGVKNGMYVKTAYTICPDLVCLPYDFDMIKLVAEKFFHILCEQFIIVYPLSCDEALVDITNEYLVKNVANKVEAVRKLIFETTKCSCSAACSSSITLCRLLLKKAKPNGQIILEPSETSYFIDNMTLADSSLFDDNMITQLEKYGFTSFRDIRMSNGSGILENILEKNFAQKIIQFSQSKFDNSDRNLVEKLSTQRKSISVNYNFGIRFKDKIQLHHLLESLCDELYSRMMNEDIEPVSLILKIMVRKPNAPIETFKHGGHGSCDNSSSSVKLASIKKELISKSYLIQKATEALNKFKFNITDLRGVSISLKNNGTKEDSSKKLMVTKKPIQSFFRPNYTTLNTKMNINETSHNNIIQDGLKINHLIPLSTTSYHSKLPMIDLIKKKSMIIAIRRNFFTNISKLFSSEFNEHIVGTIINDIDTLVQLDEYALVFQFVSYLKRYHNKIEPNAYTILLLAINDRIDLYRTSHT